MISFPQQGACFCEDVRYTQTGGRSAPSGNPRRHIVASSYRPHLDKECAAVGPDTGGVPSIRCSTRGQRHRHVDQGLDRATHQLRALLMAWVLVVSASGCVTREHQEVRQARTSYEDCVAEFSEANPGCKALLDQLRVAEERYERHSRRAWGCTTAHPDCPVER